MPTVDNSCAVRLYETVAVVDGVDVVVSGGTDHVRILETLEEGR